MRKHPVILGICILLFIGVVFFTLIYLLSLLKGDGGLLHLQAKVGVVRVEGVIADSREIIEQIDELSDDDGIRAVVLRIDSPGGGVAASQEIHRAVRKLQTKKKVIVSMGSVAASGGYLIATAADRIVANPGTITGSISAVMHFADVQELMKKVGVRSSVVKSGKFKDIGSPVRDMTPEEKQLIQGLVDDIYDQFVRTVSEDRKIPLEKILSLADGRIFSGRQALHLKLVDELGGLQDAVLLAGRLAGIEGKPAVVYTAKKKITFWRYLIENTTSVISGEIRKNMLESQGAQYLFQ
ncbi:MAG: signal peptide peptidase SppA [Syntrophus sp. (in: bacteria)]|nr:signal peptide peptidase SppA [Syntrophus sp. (in: bacteria)]